jgi:hypothetical protein
LEIETANLFIVGSFVFVSVALGVRWAVQSIYLMNYLNMPHEEDEDEEDDASH